MLHGLQMLEAPSTDRENHSKSVLAEPRRIIDYFRQFQTAFLTGIFCLILTQTFSLAVPRLLKSATDAIVESNAENAFSAALWMVGVALLAALARVISRVLIFNAGRQVEHALRKDLYEHLLAQGQDFYGGMPQGQVMSRMVNDLTQVRLLLGPGLLNVTNTTLVYLVVIPLLFYTDWVLTLCSLVTMPLLIFAGQRFAKMIYPLTAESQERLGRLSTKVQENLSGMMTVRAYRQEAEEEERFAELNEKYLEINLALARLQGVLFPFMGFAAGLGSVIVLALAGPRIQAGTMTVGGLVEFNAYLAALIWPTIALGWMLSLLQRGRSAMERVNEIFRSQPNLLDGDNQRQAASPKIEVRNLSFSYKDQVEPALKDISLDIFPGELVVVVGRTGCGKSTLLEVLTRLLPIPPNTIFLDGQAINELPLGAVRSLMGYAPQDAFLFSRSLEENVKFGRPSATQSDVRKALEIACFEVEADAFPEGLQTVIGERGVTLSGGQRQRTTLARALLVDREILMLDDTLSAVDTETESKILDALLKDRDPSTGVRRRTVVMATHRLACAQLADRILVLDEGRLVEQGREEDLLELNGVYAQMHRRQRLREAIEHQKERV